MDPNKVRVYLEQLEREIANLSASIAEKENSVTLQRREIDAFKQRIAGNQHKMSIVSNIQQSMFYAQVHQHRPFILFKTPDMQNDTMKKSVTAMLTPVFISLGIGNVKVLTVDEFESVATDTEKRRFSSMRRDENCVALVEN